MIHRTQASICCFLLGITTLVIVPDVASAQGKITVAREIAEMIGRKFTKEAADESVDVLTRKIETAIAKYGDDSADAVRNVGPRALGLIEEAGPDGAATARLLARFGDDAVWVVENTSRRALASRLGDDAAQAMIKHGAIAEPFLEKIGQPAAAAFKSVSTQNGRRIAILAEENKGLVVGEGARFFSIIEKFGDRGMEFVWKNKGALAVGAALSAFLANPEPFIDGSQNLAEVVSATVAEPIAKEIGSNTNWTSTLAVLIVALVAYMGFRYWISGPRHARR